MKKIIDIFDWILEYIFIPAITFLIWISGLFIGVFCFIEPFLKESHWWELFYLWPVGLICLAGALMPLLFVINPNGWGEMIKKNQETI